MLLTSFAGCALHDPKERYENTKALALKQKWTEKKIEAGHFILKSFLPSSHPIESELLTIFIEGDGFAWVDRHTPSSNPTPNNPMALKVALNLNIKDSAYLSRPCQNSFDNDFKNCSEHYWTYDRFNSDVIDSMDEAVSKLKKELHANKIKLVGYSGGGVIALLLANKRVDVIEVVTIASNIDTDAWTQYHDLTPMNVKNPALLSEKLKNITQIHYVGEDDDIVPASISKSYEKYYFGNKLPSIKIVKDFTHHCCWEDTNKYWIEK